MYRNSVESRIKVKLKETDMGKSKKRIFNRNKNENGSVLTREAARKNVVDAIKSQQFTSDIENLIGLFGFTHEELSEHGLSYEELKIIPHIC